MKSSLESRYPDVQIHETAIIDEGAVIGAKSRVWHWVHISGKTKIGKGCSFGQNVFVGNDVVIGNNVKVQNSVSIYDAVVLEDDVFCGPSMVFTNVINPRSAIVRKNEYLKTTVRRGATIGANATIVCGIELGEYCFIGAGAVVTKSVAPFSLILGNPGRHSGWMCKCGNRLSGQGQQTCAHCQTAYLLTNSDCRLA